MVSLTRVRLDNVSHRRLQPYDGHGARELEWLEQDNGTIKCHKRRREEPRVARRPSRCDLHVCQCWVQKQSLISLI